MTTKKTYSSLNSFLYSGWNGVLIILLYISIMVFPAIMLIFASDVREPVTEYLAFSCGVLGFTILCLQVILTSRLKFINAPFGLDIVTRFHGRIAMIAAIYFT